MSELGKSILTGLNEALEYSQGKTKLKSTKFYVAELKKFDASDIKQLRESLGFTQSIFAQIMGVSVKTVEAWENGRNNPNGSSNRLLEILSKEPLALEKMGLYQFPN